MNTRLDPASMAVLISIAALVVDRLVSATLLLLSFSKRFPDPTASETLARRVAEKKLRLFSWFLAAAFASAIVYWSPIRLLGALGLSADRLVDGLLTVLVLTGGADFVGSVLKSRGEPETPTPRPEPLEVTGKLVLEEPERSGRAAAA